MTMMKALIRNSDTPKDFAMGVAEIPTPDAGQVLIRVAYTGICGSDLHIYLGHEAGLPQGIHGHEFSGTIAKVGEGVDWEIGLAVTAEHTHSVCGGCDYCMTGRYQLCSKRNSVGFNKGGSFAEYVIADAKYVHPLPQGVDLKLGALTEPLACIIHGVELVKPSPATKTLVIGPGPMGLLAAIVLKSYGCLVDIVGTPADADRLEKAKAVGINVIDRAENNGYTLVAECSGAGGGIRAGIAALEKGGTMLQVGIAVGDVALPYDQLVYKELKIQATFCHTYPDWKRGLAMQSAGLLDVSSLITAIEPLENWEQCFEDLLEKKGMKTLLTVE